MNIKPVVLLVVLLIISAIGCGDDSKQDRKKEVTFIYSNNSNHDLELQVYNSGTLLINESINRGEVFLQRRYTESFVPAPFEADSAYILFKDPAKFAIHQANASEAAAQGVFSLSNYTGNIHTLQENYNTVRYLFTQQDYDDATPL